MKPFLSICLLAFLMYSATVSGKLREGKKRSEKKNALNETQEKDTQSYQKLFELLESMNSSMYEVKRRLAVLEDRVLGENETRLDLNSTEYLNGFIENMLSNPRATLYSEQHYTGESEEYNAKDTSFWGLCYPLRAFTGMIKSVKTHGKCVRVFYYANCEGWSLAIYPGSENSDDLLNSKLKYIWSIGPCLANEFDSAYFLDPLKQTVAKNSSDLKTYTPDLITFYNEDKSSKSTILLNSNHSIKDYMQGPHNRLEFIEAKIFPKHLTLSQQASVRWEQTGFYRALEKEEGDVVGYAIPEFLGGPLNENFNVFPHNPESKLKWIEITEGIREYLEKSSFNSVSLNLDFNYESDLSSRPYAIVYHIGYEGTSHHISYGRLVN